MSVRKFITTYFGAPTQGQGQGQAQEYVTISPLKITAPKNANWHSDAGWKGLITLTLGSFAC